MQSRSSYRRETWRRKAVYQEAEKLYEWRAAFSVWSDKVVWLLVSWWRGWGYRLTSAVWTWHYSHHQLCSWVIAFCWHCSICTFKMCAIPSMVVRIVSTKSLELVRPKVWVNWLVHEGANDSQGSYQLRDITISIADSSTWRYRGIQRSDDILLCVNARLTLVLLAGTDRIHSNSYMNVHKAWMHRGQHAVCSTISK